MFRGFGRKGKDGVGVLVVWEEGVGGGFRVRGELGVVRGTFVYFCSVSSRRFFV